jgi:ubiquitin-conjugating enzyme E2 I
MIKKFQIPSLMAEAEILRQRKLLRQSKPFGTWARPKANPDGTSNIWVWEAGIQGLADSSWANAEYPLTIKFPKEYPDNPPEFLFPPGFFHPNVYENGRVCLSIINPERGWDADTSIGSILGAIQRLLSNPNVLTDAGGERPANDNAVLLFKNDINKYYQKVQIQQQKYDISRKQFLEQEKQAIEKTKISETKRKQMESLQDEEIQVEYDTFKIAKISEDDSNDQEEENEEQKEENNHSDNEEEVLQVEEEFEDFEIPDIEFEIEEENDEEGEEEINASKDVKASDVIKSDDETICSSDSE